MLRVAGAPCVLHSALRGAGGGARVGVRAAAALLGASEEDAAYLAHEGALQRGAAGGAITLDRAAVT